MTSRKLFSVFTAILIGGILASCSEKTFDPLQYVEPGIGTAHSRWFFYTPAAVPHGMAKLAPSTNGHEGNPSGWEAVGYDIRHQSIAGFVHFHEWQIGGVSAIPATGELKVVPGSLQQPETGYRSAFNRKTEIAEPGYYSVVLDDYGVKAELTATARVGFHRYTFPESSQSRIILDVGNEQGESGEVKDAQVRMIDDTHFEGSVSTYPKYVETYDPGGEITMYIWGELNRAPLGTNAFNREGIHRESREAGGVGAGLSLEYKTAADEVLEMKVGLSYTSIANARENFQKEAAALSFDQAKQRAQESWRDELAKIQVSGGREQDRIKFYTGLYHALLGRGVANDVNGAFPLHDGTAGQIPLSEEGKPAYNFYNTDAIWGAFWNLTQLWALAYPERYNDYVNTQLEMYKHRGWFGDGISNSQFTSGVGTNFVGLAIAGAYQAGIRNFDTDLAYRAVRANELSTESRPDGSGKQDVRAFINKGYVPFLEENITDTSGAYFSASHTMEYSFSAFAAAQFASALGRESDYKELIGYAGGWEKLWDPSTKLIRPRDIKGNFIENFKPTEPWRGFQEGNAVQYTYYVPHNPAKLIANAGQDRFNERLDSIFTEARKGGFGGGKEIDAFAGIHSPYNHGNQPNLHVSWLFNYSAKPWLTQKWTRAICNEFYGVEPIHGYGYGQDEDQGQLGSWYVMSALGLFDVKGLTDLKPTVQIGSPVFDEAVIALPGGKTLTVRTIDNSPDNVYIQSATFNGKELKNAWLYHEQIREGGVLELGMGAGPNEEWGIETPPPSEL
ncbi:glycoside hydrolase family 92 protein [Olivibacter sp. SDN3]|uniref:GH92 family glycosyl hydrolase n=1 Tax=Olivibacter sp. SDN3 TaxID=2764720 RepID=UPI001651AB04|nr:GH92 family glycosyl hydrolase [Olivibacter sp. SDN3]QNL51849.1 glycoside hydrolase family 92 protein [Olivibacter sp. SDN3]